MSKKQNMIKILSVGGSIIIPQTGFDTVFLKKFCAVIIQEVKRGVRFILVVGGGSTCRSYQRAGKSVRSWTSGDLDWLGIQTTMLNAHFVRLLLKEHTYSAVITDPTKKVVTAKPIIVAGGWKPGQSTDAQAVLLAKTYGAKEIINLSNTPYIYTKDPNKFADAQKIEYMDWITLRRDIIGNTWEPGKNTPFDPVASKHAEKYGLRASFIDGQNLNALKLALRNKKFPGTIVE